MKNVDPVIDCLRSLNHRCSRGPRLTFRKGKSGHVRINVARGRGERPVNFVLRTAHGIKPGDMKHVACWLTLANNRAGRPLRDAPTWTVRIDLGDVPVAVRGFIRSIWS